MRRTRRPRAHRAARLPVDRVSSQPVSTTAPRMRAIASRGVPHPNANKESSGSDKRLPRMIATTTRKIGAVARPGRKSWASRYSSAFGSPSRIWVNQLMMSASPVKPGRMALVSWAVPLDAKFSAGGVSACGLSLWLGQEANT